MAHVLSCRVETEYDAQEPVYKLRCLRCRDAATLLAAVNIARDLVADFVMGKIGMGYAGASAKLRDAIASVVSTTHEDDECVVCFDSDGTSSEVFRRFCLEWHEDEEQYECYDSKEQVSLYVKIQ